jgi:alanine-glyoxylate transaminase/serine-glyoxylate transaminase/serine-pyruvate transaminase
MAQFPTVDEKNRVKQPPLAPPPRLLLGPGPANVDPRVSQALALPQVGHLDPFFQSLMQRIQQQLRYAWQTENKVVLPISGTGSCAMECAVVNLVEPGDKVLVAVTGYFGLRMVDMAQRAGGDVVKIAVPWGTVFTFEALKAAVAEHKPKVLGLVHAETSTGACQSLEGLGDLCKQNDCYLLVDTVTSLGGLPVLLDAWGVDACYSGTQKCLGAPPGLAPVTFSERAMAKILARTQQVRNWYLDIKLITSYWNLPGSGARAYHHTAPISMNYAFYECLRIVEDEGLEARWKRHRETAEFFWSGLEKIGLQCHVAKENRLPSLTTVKIPDDIDGAKVVAHIRDNYNIEIAGGLGELAGKVWRVGLMGFNSRKENVLLLLAALEDGLKHAKK